MARYILTYLRHISGTNLYESETAFMNDFLAEARVSNYHVHVTPEIFILTYGGMNCVVIN